MATLVDEIRERKRAMPPALPALGNALLWLLALPFFLVGWLLGAVWGLLVFFWVAAVSGYERGRW